MSDDVTGAVTGMIPMVLAIGILQKTTEATLGKKKPIGRKISLAEKKIQLKINHDKQGVLSRFRR